MPRALQPPNPRDDETPTTSRLDALLQRCGSESDHEAFAALYDDMAGRVYGLAYRVLHNSAHAEEVAQEAFIDVWLNANRYDSARGTAQNWILTIVRRRAVDRVRHVSAVERRDHVHADAETVAQADSTADLAVAFAEARVLRAALDRLPDAQRQAIELAYFGGQTHQEIAALLQVPLGTGKTRIRDGLQRLRTEFQAARGPEGSVAQTTETTTSLAQ